MIGQTVGPRMEPCGSPDAPTTTVSLQSVKNYLVHSSIIVLIPVCIRTCFGTPCQSRY